MQRITFVVILAIVAVGGLVVWYSRGRTVKSMGENRTTTSRDGTNIALYEEGIRAATNHSGRRFLLSRKWPLDGVGLAACATLHSVHV